MGSIDLHLTQRQKMTERQLFSCRKQKERKDRDALILECAHEILVQKGLHHLNMQAVAAKTDYSKGTIYQHYSCKEDLMAALVMICGERLLTLMARAIKSPEPLRARIGLMTAAFFLNGLLDRAVANLVPIVKSADFQQKISAKNVDKLNRIDEAIFQSSLEIFSRNDHDLKAAQVKDAVFGWWAMNWGFNDVIHLGLDIKRLGYTDAFESFFRSLNIFLDGLGVDQDAQHSSWPTMLNLIEDVFADIVSDINQKNKKVQND